MNLLDYTFNGKQMHKKRFSHVYKQGSLHSFNRILGMSKNILSKTIFFFVIFRITPVKIIFVGFFGENSIFYF